MKTVVTGGGGFLGRRIVERLLAEGEAVRVVGRGAYPDLEARGIECVRADLAERDAARRALEGAGAVIHCAAKAGVWGPRAEYERCNVQATRAVLEACRAHGIERLVHTSTPSVCFDGADQRGASELPYARRFLAHYPRTKAAAERAVLAANGPSLATIALRPHLLFGPGDPHLVPRLLARAEAGRLAVVGDGRNEVSLTYVDDAAHAHVCALRALVAGAPCAGRAYFVANVESVRLWEWIAALLERLGRPALRRRIPLGAAWTAGALCEVLWRALARPGEPPMTRFVALQLARSHTYDVSPLARDLGYVEQVGLARGTDRLVESLRRVD